MRHFFIILAVLTLGLNSLSGQRWKKKIKLSKGKENVEEPVNAVLINTPGFDFSPAYYQNGIVYVSQYRGGPVDENTRETFFELF